MGSERGVRVHEFNTTKYAYDQTQTNDDIRSGDVIIAVKEGVVGILDEAWPVAITVARGEFHTWKAPVREIKDNAYGESFTIAERKARELGFAISPVHLPPGSERRTTAPVNKRSQDMLRTFAHELPRPDSPDDDGPGPLGLARLMAEWNNDENGSKLDYFTTWSQSPDHTWCEIAWVFDKRRCMTEDGGDVVMCWWQETSCPDCNGERTVTIYDHSTDARIGWRNCDYEHPEPPPPPVSLVKPHQCTDDLCCPPF